MVEKLRKGYAANGKTWKVTPFQQGSSLNAAGINYTSLQAVQAMKRLKELGSLPAPNN